MSQVKSNSWSRSAKHPKIHDDELPHSPSADGLNEVIEVVLIHEDGANNDANIGQDNLIDADSAARHPKLEQLLTELDTFTVSDDAIQAVASKKKIHQFYEDQNELVDGYREVVGLLAGGSEESEHAASQKEAKQARNITLILDVAFKITLVMLCLKTFSAAWSGSIAVIASAVDSVLDVVSQGGLVLAERFMRRKDPVTYPIGKSRLESLVVMAFGMVMMMAAVVLLQQSGEVLQSGLSEDVEPSISFNIVPIVLMATTIGTQVGVWLVCRRIIATSDPNASNIGSVDALGQDQMNDILVNTLSTVAAAIATANNDLWYLDPIIGLVVSFYMLARWFANCYEQFMSLLGKSADRNFINRLTYLSMIHDDRILKVDTVCAYQLGTKIHAEVHIVLPADMSLRVAHDIGESLEKNIEKIPEVELAWVHLDFEWQHQAEHNRAKL